MITCCGTLCRRRCFADDSANRTKDPQFRMTTRVLQRKAQETELQRCIPVKRVSSHHGKRVQDKNCARSVFAAKRPLSVARRSSLVQKKKFRRRERLAGGPCKHGRPRRYDNHIHRHPAPHKPSDPQLERSPTRWVLIENILTTRNLPCLVPPEHVAQDDRAMLNSRRRYTMHDPLQKDLLPQTTKSFKTCAMHEQVQTQCSAPQEEESLPCVEGGFPFSPI